jgi:uncharacterized protein YvpB
MVDPTRVKKPTPADTYSFLARRRNLAWLLSGIAILFLGALFLDGQETPAIPLTPSPLTPSLSTSNPVNLSKSAQLTTSFPAIWTPSATPTIRPTLTPTASITPTSLPNFTPTPTLPLSFQVHGIVPRRQKLSLDCESNDATLLAGFLGYKIDELEFQAALPKSDNPNLGFVGDVNSVWGSTPPEAYGVHASPVAITLHRYHVPVLAVFQYSLENLKLQLANGNPVMVWVVGHVEKGKAIPWKSSDGYITYVAPYEHTVLVIGYDAAGVTILDNSEIYGRSYQEFMDSWSVLGYMAIIKYP